MGWIQVQMKKVFQDLSLSLPHCFCFCFSCLHFLLFFFFQHGSNLIGMTDLNVPEQLYQYMVGGHRRAQVGANRERHKSPSYQIKVDGRIYSLLITPTFGKSIISLHVFFIPMYLFLPQLLKSISSSISAIYVILNPNNASCVLRIFSQMYQLLLHLILCVKRRRLQ